MRYVSYLRVSTDKQGRTGLGIDAQRQAVAKHIGSGDLVAECVEVESGRRNDRPELAKALAQCKLVGAVLIVAKLDRLSRNQAFLMSIYEGCGEGGVVFCDLPTIPPGPMGKYLVQQMAAVAELERGLTSERTKAALARSTKKLGGYRGGPVPDAALGATAIRDAADKYAAMVGPMVTAMRAESATLQAIANRLTADRVRTSRGGAWSVTAVRNLLERYRRLQPPSRKPAHAFSAHAPLVG